MVKAQVCKLEILGYNPGQVFLFNFFSSISFVNFYPSIISSLNPSFPSSFSFLSSPHISPLFMLTLFVVTMQTNYTKTKSVCAELSPGETLITWPILNGIPDFKDQ